MDEPKFLEIKDGEAIIIEESFYLSCCDCGLVHRILIKTIGEGVEFRFYRDKEATEQRRKDTTKLFTSVPAP